MLTLIRWLIARFRRKKELPPQQELAVFLEGLRRMSAAELGGVLAGAAQARKTLDSTRIVSMPFPLEHFGGALPLDGTATESLLEYLSEMKRFKAVCLAEASILTISVARGLDVWIATVWALTLPAVEAGREMWAMLAQGEGNVESAYRFMVRRDLTDVERDYLTYRPRILAD